MSQHSSSGLIAASICLEFHRSVEQNRFVLVTKPCWPTTINNVLRQCAPFGQFD